MNERERQSFVNAIERKLGILIENRIDQILNQKTTFFEFITELQVKIRKLGIIINDYIEKMKKNNEKAIRLQAHINDLEKNIKNLEENEEKYWKYHLNKYHKE